MRFAEQKTRAELIGFFSNYGNIKGICSESTGCDLSADQTYSGGKAKIYGVEAVAENEWRSGAWFFPVRLSYNYNFAEFLRDQPSENPEWGIGEIKKGDPLPYIPDHKSFVSLGTHDRGQGYSLEAQHTGQRFDQAVVTGRRVLSSYVVIDALAWWNLTNLIRMDLKVDNLSGQVYETSLRPYGYRPGKPRTVSLGVFSGTY